METGKSEQQGMEQQFTQSMTEVHSVVPGLFALFGFQLMAAFNDVFAKKLTAVEKGFYVGALVLLAFGATLLMTPAAYHRQARTTTISEGFNQLIAKLTTTAMIPLMLVFTIDVYLITKVASARVWLSVIPAGIVLGVCFALWFIFPQRQRRKLQTPHPGTAPWPL